MSEQSRGAPGAPIDRRGFLAGSVAGGLALGVGVPSMARAQNAGSAPCPSASTAPAPAPVPVEATERLIALDAGLAEDWKSVEASKAFQEGAIADTLLGMLRGMRGVYAGFGVDQLLHMTQAATRAVRANASDELVLVSLFHDVGKLISNRNHPEIASAILRPYVSDGAYRILRHHMEFQWKHYGAQILKPTNLRDRYRAEPWYLDAERFSDEWDQVAFDPAYATMPIEEFEPLVRGLLGRTPPVDSRGARDCTTST